MLLLFFLFTLTSTAPILRPFALASSMPLRTVWGAREVGGGFCFVVERESVERGGCVFF